MFNFIKSKIKPNTVNHNKETLKESIRLQYFNKDTVDEISGQKFKDIGYENEMNFDEYLLAYRNIQISFYICTALIMYTIFLIVSRDMIITNLLVPSFTLCIFLFFEIKYAFTAFRIRKRLAKWDEGIQKHTLSDFWGEIQLSPMEAIPYSINK